MNLDNLKKYDKGQPFKYRFGNLNLEKHNSIQQTLPDPNSEEGQNRYH